MTSVVIQGNERGTYSRARTSYVEDIGETSSVSSKPQVSAARSRSLFRLGATQGYGIAQQRGVHSLQDLDVLPEDGVG